MHVHCVVVAVERSDERIVTPNQAAWMRHGREGGAYFRSELASRLLELGLEIETVTGKQGRFFEVAGVPREVCDRLSGRSREVDSAYAEFVARYGRAPVDGELGDLAAKSRERKGPETVAEIEPYWRAVAAEHGFDEAAAMGLWGREIELVPADDELRRQVEAEVLARIERQGATVRSREARAIAYEASAGVLEAHEAMELIGEMQQRGVLLPLTEDRVTTRNIRAHERYCIDATRRIAVVPVTPPRGEVVRASVRSTERVFGVALSPEQVASVDVVTSDARITGLVGRAGTGKGVVIHAASNAYRDEGWQVLACATQGARAQGLAEQTNGRAMTIDQLVHRAHAGRLSVDARTVVFVDEAGMVDTLRMAQLVDLVERSGCSLRLVGDPAQLSAIGPGGLLPSMLAAEFVPVAELTEIHRTPHRWIRDAQNLVRDGRSQEALALMSQHDALHMLDTQAEAMQRMVADWDRWRRDYDAGDTLLVVHTMNADVDAVNQLAQAHRAAAGELRVDGVRSPDRDYLLYEGDRVMLRERAYYLDDHDEPRVENGTRGTVIGVNIDANTIDVRLDESGRDEQRVVTFELDRCNALRLDYASHVYPAQGDTRSRTAELTGGPSVNRENAYVGGTRLRDRHDLYTSREVLGTDGDDRVRWNRLAEQMNESRAQAPSLAYREQRSREIAVEPPPLASDVELAKLDTLDRDLVSAKQQLVQLEREFPHETQRAVKRHAAQHRAEKDLAQQAAEARDRTRQELERLRPWQRQEIKEARAIIERLNQRIEDHQRSANEHAREHNRIIAGAGSLAQWRRDHGAELTARREHVEKLTRDRDAQRERLVRRAIEQPPRYITRALGERPPDQAQRTVWERGVRAIEDYRIAYGVRERHTALGREPGFGSRHSDFDRAVQRIDEARRAIGRDRDAHAIARDRDGRSRAITRGGMGRGR